MTQLATRRAALFGFALMLTACATAQHGELEPLVTDRPDYTESTETVPSGILSVRIRQHVLTGAGVADAILR